MTISNYSTSKPVCTGLVFEIFRVVAQVGLMKRRLAVPEGIPAVLAEILASCTAAEKEDRPCFLDVSKKLTQFLQETRGYDFAVPSAVPVRRPAGAKPAGRSTI